MKTAWPARQDPPARLTPAGDGTAFASRLADALGLAETATRHPAEARAADELSMLVVRGLDQLPPPGTGGTLQRWQALAQVAGHDLSLAKLYEGHTDALAILQELDADADRGDEASDARWCVWAAEAPGGRVELRGSPGGGVVLDGRKCWCSGAATASHALLTAWEAGTSLPQLVRISLAQPGVSVLRDAWQAVGMAGSASVDVQLHAVRGDRVGAPGDYLTRPGFWQGGAGIAACWYGGAVALALALRRALAAAAPESQSPFRLAALGRVDLALHGTAVSLREAAAWIDAHPLHDASTVALRVRLIAERAAGLVLDEVGRALGAGPFCRDAGFARMAADLPVFVRQSHAERDCAALAERLLSNGGDPWPL